jgi:hypothetical protein
MKKPTKRDYTKELAEELDTFDEMLSVLIELLETKGILAQNEFETQLKARIEKKATKRSYRDIQFDDKNT